ncbi:MAG: hypothetical protein LBV69_01105, partial [Bacteroidales bacterium]|nr:hypothetical protein [Bacteroidales bacterium]
NFLLKDYLGSVLKIVDANGTTIEEHSYDPWGNHRSPTTWEISDFTGSYRGYTGHEMLPQYALINMNGRMYDPVISRVLSPDNFVQDTLNAQNFNRYSYCLNNPLKYSDPSGWLIDDYFDKNGKFLYRDNKKTDFIWIVSGEIDAITGNGNYDRSDLFIKTRIEDTKLSREAVLNIVNFYDKELGAVEGKDNNVELKTRVMDRNIIMQQEVGASHFLFGFEFWKGSESILINYKNNSGMHKVLNAVSNIKNALVHEYKHNIDKRNGYTKETTLEIRAIEKQKQHSTYNKTTPEYKKVIKRYEDYYQNREY